MSRVLLVGNSAYYLLQFRAELIRSFVLAGHQVRVCCAPEPGSAERFAELGASEEAWDLDPLSQNPVSELRALLQLRSILSRLRPDYVFSFTIKPNSYCGLLARTQPFRLIPTLTGLGTAFLEQGLSLRMIRKLLRLALDRADHVFVQNADDHQIAREELAVPAARLEIVPGSGIRLEHFAAHSPPPLQPTAPLTCSYVGRFLAQKGIREFAVAARTLHAQKAKIRFLVFGDEEAANRSLISRAELAALAGPALEFRGFLADAREAYAQSHFVVLPSYREGMSRSLIEAAACGVPGITSDRPGCRDIVRDGESGFLCAAQSSEALVAALRRALELSPAQHARMSAAARLGAERFASSICDPPYLAQLL
ncbi:MAG: hypothetical protein CSA62_01715 [Planctomycetota bacterium]|nr:MAG: hypothetical protein CSA62_01715 [Planctomycetota bacterium]